MKLIPIDDYITINKIRLCYYDAGAGDIPIILIHGFPFSKEMWKHQVAFLKDKHRVIAYDLRGFGKSSSFAETDVSIDLYADDLVMFMDALHIKRAIICGFSMGGYILLNALHRYSNRFIAAILCDTQCVADTGTAYKKRYKAALKIENNGLKSFATDFLTQLFSRNTLGDRHPLVQFLMSIILSTSPKTIADSLRAIANREQTCSMLNQIKVPTLIICGEYDKVTPVKRSQYLHDNIVGSSFVIINNVEHMSNLEEIDQFNKILDDFIDNCIKKNDVTDLFHDENLLVMNQSNIN